MPAFSRKAEMEMLPDGLSFGFPFSFAAGFGMERG